jgi:uncharacterized membrane protein
MTQTGYTAPAPSRPLGVAIIAILLGLYGLLTFIGGLFIVVFSNYGIDVTGSTQFGVTGTILGAVLVILGLIELGVAVGLWHLRMWALVLAVLVLLVDLASPIYNLVTGRGIGVGLLGFVIALILLIYLIAVRRHFR